MYLTEKVVGLGTNLIYMYSGHIIDKKIHSKVLSLSVIHCTCCAGGLLADESGLSVRGERVLVTRVLSDWECRCEGVGG